MKTVATAMRFFVYSNLFIALCATAYAIKTSFLLYRNYGSIHVSMLVFSATLLFYCFHRINKKKFTTPDENLAERNLWMNSHRNAYYVLMAASIVCAALQIPYLPLRIYTVLIPTALLSLGYTFSVIPSRQGWKRLRDIYWLKPLWIAIAFSILTTFLPVLYIEPFSAIPKAPVMFMFVRAVLFIFCLCIPFDIRDMEFDKLRKTRTLPVVVGAKTSACISISVMLLFISFVCIQFLYFNLDFKSAAALFVSAIITIALMPLSIANRSALFYPLVYDGSMLLQCIIIIMFIRM